MTIVLTGHNVMCVMSGIMHIALDIPREVIEAPPENKVEWTCKTKD